MIKAGIIGGAGYTAGELIRILSNHPEVEIVWVNSSSNAGNPVASVHQGLIGDCDLVFTSETPFEQIDVLFFCTPHGQTRKYIEEFGIPQGVKIVDLSTDYRHEAPSHDFVYGLPELNREAIRKAIHVANPGCFATAIQLGLLPLAKAGLIKQDVNVFAITGSTGAGVKPSATSHFSWRNDNVSIYKPFKHQHLDEICQSLRHLQPEVGQPVKFIPVRGCFSRGIFATLYTECALPLEEVKAMYQDFYKDAAFTFVVDKQPDLKDVVNTNKCLVYLAKEGDTLLIISCIDNLAKGASGTAVHNMNLMFGLDERAGLRLKGTAF